MKRISLLIISLLPLLTIAQNDFSISGNFEITSQTYIKDTTIDAPDVAEKLLYNAYSNLLMSYKNFSAGVRFEAYQNALLGYDRRYNGQGIPYRFAQYSDSILTVTIGNFYEQFGNGLVLRSFEDRTLGYDNSFDGINIHFSPVKGLTIKALAGKQRYFWDKGVGIVRAADAEADLNAILKRNSSTNLIIGGSFVSKYQKDDNPVYRMPENVGAFAGRINLISGYFNLNAEFAYKINDPSADNQYIYKSGSAAYLTMSYSKPGFGIILTADRYDNMSFRSDVNANQNSLQINSLPSIVKTHLFALQEIYPYTVQPLGEMGASLEVFYKIKRKSKIGGKYGMIITASFTKIKSIDKTPVFDGTGYTSRFFVPGQENLYQTAEIMLKKKFSRKYKSALSYMNLTYNKDYVQGLVGYGTVHANIAAWENTFKLSAKKSLRTEIQALFSKQDLGNFLMIFAEYSISPHWFFSAYDQYNYANTHLSKNIHYYDMAITYVSGPSRLMLSYGRHREGILCVGGVCRNVPASNGFNLTISTTF